MTFQFDISGEEWRAVVGYEGLYEISSFGRVRSLPRTVNRGGRAMQIAGLPMRLKTNRCGYLYVNISKGGKQIAIGVHRLVADAFIPNPEGKPEVNHLDNDTGNPMVDNLAWATRAENMAHAASQVRLRGHLTSEDIQAIRTRWPTLSAGEKGAYASTFNITGSHLWRIGTGRAHRHVA